MKMSEGQQRAPKDYSPVAEEKWRETHPFGIDYREDSPNPKAHKLVVRLDGTADDLTVSGGTYDEKCVDKVDGQGTVLSYSDDSMEDCGTVGPGRGMAREGVPPCISAQGVPRDTRTLQRPS